MDDALLPASRGAGPLLQRDYWAVLADCPMSPSELMAHVKSRFCEFPPPALVTFTAANGFDKDSRVDIVIVPGQLCAVHVIDDSPQSLTLATVEGHPEAGRITFGSYRNAADAVIFHIRSRARSTTALKRLGFLALGEAMQTNTWTDFIRNVATSVGAGIDGVIHAETQEVEDLPEDDEPLRSPTFRAVGD